MEKFRRIIGVFGILTCSWKDWLEFSRQWYILRWFFIFFNHTAILWLLFGFFILDIFQFICRNSRLNCRLGCGWNDRLWLNRYLWWRHSSHSGFAFLNHLIDHLIVVLCVLSSFRIVTHSHLTIKSLNWNWVVNYDSNLFKHFC